MKSFSSIRCFNAIAALVFICTTSAWAQENDPFVKMDDPALTGRWDWKVTDGDAQYPSWMEVELSGYRTLVGSYVGQFGSARPIGNIDFNAKTGEFRFTLPPQWEKRTTRIVFEGKLEGDTLRGETSNADGETIHFIAQRSPSLEREGRLKWGKKI